MCGICGKLALAPDGHVPESLVRDMALMIAHRGPNDDGFYFKDRIGMGQRRLSIIDVAGGRQPIGNEDGSAWIIFNGEVYNHAEVRRDLEARGHRYKTRTDTETILHAYEEYGVECVKQLRGMFAFAIWDEREQALFIARDRFGIKPLYYWKGARSLSFASEMKAILIDPDVEVSLDPVALYDYFTFKYIPGPNTPFREIKRLQPAHWMLVKGGQVRIERYWDPAYTGDARGSADDHLAELEERLKASIDEHLMSEVPQGVFLSGGVDSSLIVALMASLVNEPLRTFSIGFDGKPGFDESRYAKAVADQYGTRHDTFPCPPESAENLPRIYWHLEEPLADAAMIPLYELCHQATKHVTVVHCGDGGDEGFAGYTRFYWDRLAGAYGAVPEALRLGAIAPLARLGQRFPGRMKELCRRIEKFSRFAGLDPAARYTNWFTMIDDDAKHAMLAPGFLEDVGRHRSDEVFEAIFADAARLNLAPLPACQYCELRSFIPDDLMLKSDKIAMSAGLEGRFPFLDDRLIEFGLSLPANHKIRGSQLKILLKRLLAKHMPPEFVYRRKQGFEVPVDDWFRTKLDAQLRETVAGAEAHGDGIFDTQRLKQMIARLHDGDPVAGKQLFVVFAFEQWRRVFEHPQQACLDHLRAAKALRT